MRFSYSGAVAAAFCLASGHASAINITPTGDASALAGSLFLNLPGLTITNVSLDSTADRNGFTNQFQSGLFQNPQGTYGLPAAGIALSTGNVADYATGPNLEDGATTAFNMGDSDDSLATPAQETLLQPITGIDQHYDAVQLDIEFFASFGDVPDSSGFETPVVNFFASFGSEEFPEYVNGGVNDGFGLYVNGQNVAFAQQSGGGPLSPINIDHPDMRDIAGTELDGVLAPNGNPVLRFEVPINVGQLNTFTIILADAGDEIVDSTVYLSSFFANPGPGGGGGGGGGGGIFVPGGETEFDPILPSNPPDPDTGEFVIEIPDVPPGQTVWIDPPVSVGYTYETNDGTEFETVSAPSLATVPDLDGYIISAGGMSAILGAGAMFDFLAEFGFTPTMFTISGIDPALMLDPTNPLAFPLGVSFQQATFSTTVTITPTVAEFPPTGVVPLPGGAALYLGGIALAGLWRARRRG